MRSSAPPSRWSTQGEHVVPGAGRGGAARSASPVSIRDPVDERRPGGCGTSQALGVDVVAGRRGAAGRPCGWPASVRGRAARPGARRGRPGGHPGGRPERRPRALRVVLVEEEEERAVPEDRPAEAAPTWLRLKRGGDVRPEAFSRLLRAVELAGGVVIPRLAPEGVGAGPRHHVDLGPAVAAELRTVGVGQHLELRHPLRHHLHGRDRDRDVVVVRAVDHVVVVAGALAVDGVGALADGPARRWPRVQ